MTESALTASQVYQRLRREIEANRALLVAGAGSGLVAKCAELAGADMIAVYNSGYFRRNGWPSSLGFLPLANANSLVLSMGESEILPAVAEAPVIAGVLAADPTMNIRHHLEAVAHAGFAGVINFPTIGRIDGGFRRDLEALGFGIETEYRMFEQALGLGQFTAAYAFTPVEAARFADIGVHAIIAHMGTTSGGLVGKRNVMALDEAAMRVEEILDATRGRGSDVIMLCHGGPIASAQDASHILQQTSAVGFVGASSVERLPIEVALEDTVGAFKAISVTEGRPM